MPPARASGGSSRSVQQHSDKKRDYHATAVTPTAFSDFSVPVPKVDLSKLETAALKRYRRHFKLMEVGPNSSKEQLLHAVCRHFTTQQLDERQVIAGFVQAAKRQKTQ